MRDERERFEIALEAREVAQIVDAADFDVDGNQSAAGGKQACIHVGGAIHSLQGAGVFAAAILKLMRPTHVGVRGRTARASDQYPVAAHAPRNVRERRWRAAVDRGEIDMEFLQLSGAR